MTGMQEVPTDELLSFQDFPEMPNPSTYQNVTTASIQITDDIPEKESSRSLEALQRKEDTISLEDGTSKAFWTLNYYQQFFDVDTSEVVERLWSSVIPKGNKLMSNQIKLKPDLYGPFWISMTLIFTIAISGNVASYLQHANEQYHWKYNFHLVSYASTAIVIYVSIIPLVLWGLLKWTIESSELEQLVEETISTPLELACVYGYSLFIYIPVSILCSIQIMWLQWILVLIATVLSGAVLVFTLYPALQLSKRKFILMAYIVCCHLLLAIGFKVFFFHMPDSTFSAVTHPPLIPVHQAVSQHPNVTIDKDIKGVKL
ncbi:hypothetical protein PPYR_08021 [Photinus pyralis]|uniref:Protein YIPF n=1 Tax=Photinus pyralis TaxID=7054 RepID=A0A5N4AS47_PHOPY|nr:protein YIPF1 isoform X2 [Photinus pyralis]KAB0800141.1 hypothetical protein PPYR_08021 [Photinus pyralis]